MNLSALRELERCPIFNTRAELHLLGHVNRNTLTEPVAVALPKDILTHLLNHGHIADRYLIRSEPSRAECVGKRRQARGGTFNLGAHEIREVGATASLVPSGEHLKSSSQRKVIGDSGVENDGLMAVKIRVVSLSFYYRHHALARAWLWPLLLL